MAQRRGTDPAVDRPQTGYLSAEVPKESTDTITDLPPNVSLRQSNLPNIVSPTQSNLSRNSGPRSTGSSSGQRAQRKPSNRDPPPQNVIWVNGRYYELNPWYSQPRTKPLFSLGRPLPHVVRWEKKPTVAPVAKAPEELAERGEIGGEASSNVEKQESGAGSRSSGARRTAAGVSHGDRYNDAGQPVFEYQPGEEDATRRERTNETHDTNKGSREDLRNYGIDSEPLGPREHEDVKQSDEDPNESLNWWARLRAKHPEPFAEFLATGMAVFMALGATLSVNLSASQEVKYGDYATACWASGLSWMFGIYIAGGVSGAHMNPAISISLSLFRGFPWRSCLIYVFVQFVAGLTAGALAFGIYRDTIRYVDPTMTSTAKTFFSSPQEWVSMGTAFFDQVVGSAIMMIAVFALGDDRNNPPGAGMHALVLGLLLTTLKFALGYNIGSALNPASDFGPRVVAWAVGYRGPEVFQTGWWFYGPWLGTIAGSIIGSALYDGLVFAGPESPINCRINRGDRKRTHKLFR